jgi:hypothetical protein
MRPLFLSTINWRFSLASHRPADVDPLGAGSLTQVARQFSGRSSSAARITRNDPMKFMFIVKSAHSVAPTPALLEAMHKLADREIKAGRMLDNGGLMPMAAGARPFRTQDWLRTRGVV